MEVNDGFSTSIADPSAFVELFEQHFDAIFIYLRRRVGPELGEELAAETFTVAFDRRERFDRKRGQPLPWLYGIAANLLRRHRRSEERRLRAYARACEKDVGTNDVERVVATASAQARSREIARALAKLKAGDREALLLLAWADLSYQEIASALAVPIGTVRSRINRARNQLRELLGDCGQELAESVLVEQTL